MVNRTEDEAPAPVAHDVIDFTGVSNDNRGSDTDVVEVGDVQPKKRGRPKSNIWRQE
jgi:hypothetical protein